MRILVTLGVVLTAITFLGPVGRLSAQGWGALTMEMRGGITLPAPDLVEPSSGGPARSIGLTAEFQLFPELSFYGGYSSYMLEPRRDYTQQGSGYDVGARLRVPLGQEVSLWLRGGATLHRLTATFPGSPHPTQRVKSEPALGGELGSGVEFSHTRGFALAPGLRYHSYSATMDISEVFERPGASSELRTQYFTLDLGLRYQW